MIGCRDNGTIRATRTLRRERIMNVEEQRAALKARRAGLDWEAAALHAATKALSASPSADLLNVNGATGALTCPSSKYGANLRARSRLVAC
jgi:hypothetical protein